MNASQILPTIKAIFSYAAILLGLLIVAKIAGANVTLVRLSFLEMCAACFALASIGR